MIVKIFLVLIIMTVSEPYYTDHSHQFWYTWRSLPCGQVWMCETSIFSSVLLTSFPWGLGPEESVTCKMKYFIMDCRKKCRRQKPCLRITRGMAPQKSCFIFYNNSKYHRSSVTSLKMLGRMQIHSIIYTYPVYTILHCVILHADA